MVWETRFLTFMDIGKSFVHQVRMYKVRAKLPPHGNVLADFISGSIYQKIERVYYKIYWSTFIMSF